MLHRSKNSPVVVLLRVDSKSLSSTLHALHLIGLAVPWLVGKVHYTILDLWIKIILKISVLSFAFSVLARFIYFFFVRGLQAGSVSCL